MITQESSELRKRAIKLEEECKQLHAKERHLLQVANQVYCSACGEEFNFRCVLHFGIMNSEKYEIVLVSLYTYTSQSFIHT